MGSEQRRNLESLSQDRYERSEAEHKQIIRETAQKFIDSLSDPAVHAWCAKVLFAKLVEERGLPLAGSPRKIQPKVAELCEILEAYYKRELEQSNL
jgi:hypothetical protein